MMSEIVIYLGILFSVGLLFSAYKIKKASMRTHSSSNSALNPLNSNSFSTNSVNEMDSFPFSIFNLLNSKQYLPGAFPISPPHLKKGRNFRSLSPFPLWENTEKFHYLHQDIEKFCISSNALQNNEMINIILWIDQHKSLCNRFQENIDNSHYLDAFIIVFEKNVSHEIKLKETQNKLQELMKIYSAVSLGKKYFLEFNSYQNVIDTHFNEYITKFDGYTLKFIDDNIGKTVINIE